jgi:hypothetical protein
MRGSLLVILPFLSFGLSLRMHRHQMRRVVMLTMPR